MPFWMGVEADCEWAYTSGHLTQAEWFELIDKQAEACGQGGPAKFAIAVAYKSDNPNADVRRRYATVLGQALADNPEFLAHAMVMDSALVRGGLTAINWLWRKRFPEKVFATPRNAFEWLAGHGMTANGRDIWVAIAGAVPEKSLSKSGYED